ncbi:MAG: NAD-dependent epimerase/dehydratase family protein [Alphaproteobacteria bacterium]|nr:NAD-dependent epimerase/dehydratase family protein [Alphaproteobacteria bacterium]
MKFLVTGVAGFIGAALTEALLKRGDEVVGIDNLNDYYDVNLKKTRLDILQKTGGAAFSFFPYNIADKEAIFSLADVCKGVSQVVSLAAQAGVRYSLANPYVYMESNGMGFVVMAEFARRLPDLKQFVYASSSSVYGGNTKTPFSVEDPVDKPVSLYAATKRGNELMAHTYAHLYKMPCIGLRFFTVYGPWGRPDMAAYLFTSNIMAGKPINVFNNGKMRRDFTYIDDIVSGVIGAIDTPAKFSEGELPNRIYNLGNSRSENLMDFIAEIEKAVGKKAVCRFLPMQAGDVLETFADVSASTRDFGYMPKTPISAGILRFVDWYRKYHDVGA